MAIDDFLNPENENIIEENEPTIEEILEIVRGSEAETETNIAESDDDSSELPMLSVKEAVKSLDKVVRLFLAQESDYSKEIDNLVKAGRVLRRLKENSFVQKSLDDYFEKSSSPKEKGKGKLVQEF